MRPSKSFLFFAFFGGAAASYGVACGSSDFAGGADGDSGTINGQNCNGADTPAASPCVVQDAFGVFVDSNANASVAQGTKAQPFTTIQAGIDAAKDSKKHVFVCVGQYAEQLTLADGVSMFGNMDCTNNWQLVSQHAVDKAPKSPVATADQVVSQTLIDSLDFIAPDGTSSDRSSIGLVVTASTGLTISNATVQAGNGFNGVDGVEGIQLTQTGSINGTGSQTEVFAPTTGPVSCGGSSPPAICFANIGMGGTSDCAASLDAGIDGATYNGGPGGNGGQGGYCQLTQTGSLMVGGTTVTTEYCHPAAVMGDGFASNGLPQPGNPATAQGAVFTPPKNATSGQGEAEVDGANGTSHWDGVAFVVSDGTPGHDGTPGQGGGGGSGDDPVFGGTGELNRYARGNLGAGGGAGGCPGLAGTAGTGGGASIAIVTSDSPIILLTCVVKAGNGGSAGKGTMGSDGTTGGLAGANNSMIAQAGNADPLCAAGAGSAGGNSGWSGNGSAGPSYGVASHGAAPLLQQTGPQARAGGAGVDVRTQGPKTIPATPAGESAPTMTF